jgi:hypothetical protein
LFCEKGKVDVDGCGLFAGFGSGSGGFGNTKGPRWPHALNITAKATKTVSVEGNFAMRGSCNTTIFKRFIFKF